jgi:hypothetical protein
VDITTGLSYAMDMTPLIQDASLVPAAFVGGLIQAFSRDVAERLARLC